jgi:hypothetical protein
VHIEKETTCEGRGKGLDLEGCLKEKEIKKNIFNSFFLVLVNEKVKRRTINR